MSNFGEQHFEDVKTSQSVTDAKDIKSPQFRNRVWKRSESSEDGCEWQSLHSLCEFNNLPSSEANVSLRSNQGTPDQIVPFHTGRIRCSSECSKVNALMKKWRNVAKKCTIYPLTDPWLYLNFGEIPIQRCMRHRYSSIRKEWNQDLVYVKMHPEAFARGAVRECFRLKKTSGKDDNWAYAMNYVAKKYIKDIDRQVLFEDVKLQMDSKLWAEEYNRHNPPKKIDIFQMCVIEFVDEPNSPLFHLEHYIDGDYVKYNSNSGFVSDISRKTPHAFSHFTFERSGHQLMVVDIQGVGDLYTDPQIHTASGAGYSDGNLGTKGMALFFHSHICNEICKSLCLTDFDLCESERRALQDTSVAKKVCDPSTAFFNVESLDPCSALVSDLDESAMECLRTRTRTYSSNATFHNSFASHSILCTSDAISQSNHEISCTCNDCILKTSQDVNGCLDNQLYDTWSTDKEIVDGEVKHGLVRARVRYGSSSSCCSSRQTGETERESFWLEARKLSRPAGHLSDTQIRELVELGRQTHTISILGQIHLDLARYHELGRFVDFMDLFDEAKSQLNDSVCAEKGCAKLAVRYDKDAALYHLNIARQCGVLEAIVTVAQITFGLPHDLLKEVSRDDYLREYGTQNMEELGFDLMETAAEMGERSAMLFIADAYETGIHLGDNRSPYWPKAIEWYNRSMSVSDESEGSNCDVYFRPHYELLQKMAEMYKEGGYGLDQDLSRAYELFTEAAEAAIESMRGKLASKLYEMAEQCYC